MQKIILFFLVASIIACTKPTTETNNNGTLKSITSLNDFNEKTKTGVSLVFFHASWCSICKAQKPHIEEAAQLESLQSVFFGEVEFDDHSDITNNQNVGGFPTIVIYKNATEVKRLTGKGHDKNKLESLLKEHL